MVTQLEMIDQEMYWSAPDGIGAWIRRGQCGRCTFQKSSGQITCENAEATLKEEDIEEFVRVLLAATEAKASNANAAQESIAAETQEIDELLGD